MCREAHLALGEGIFIKQKNNPDQRVAPHSPGPHRPGPHPPPPLSAADATTHADATMYAATSVAATTAGGHQQQHGREVAPAGQPPGSGEVATTTTVGRHNHH
jgi:hypothetical protein